MRIYVESFRFDNPFYSEWSEKLSGLFSRIHIDEDYDMRFIEMNARDLMVEFIRLEYCNQYIFNEEILMYGPPPIKFCGETNKKIVLYYNELVRVFYLKLNFLYSCKKNAPLK